MRKIELSPPKITAISAVVMVVATFGAWKFLEKQQDRLINASKMTPVLRAKRYIGVGKNLTVDVVETIEMPERFVPPGALADKSALLNAQGKPRFKARVGLPKADIVLRSELADDSSSMGLAWTLQPGETAVALRLNLDDAIAGLLRPGDLVHVLWTSSGRARLLLTNVRVGAVQDKLWEGTGGAPAQADDFSKVMASDSILVTLILPPRDALLARLAAMQAHVTLALASPLDTEAPALEHVTGKDL